MVHLMHIIQQLGMVQIINYYGITIRESTANTDIITSHGTDYNGVLSMIQLIII